MSSRVGAIAITGPRAIPLLCGALDAAAFGTIVPVAAQRAGSFCASPAANLLVLACGEMSACAASAGVGVALMNEAFALAMISRVASEVAIANNMAAPAAATTAIRIFNEIDIRGRGASKSG